VEVPYVVTCCDVGRGGGPGWWVELRSRAMEGDYFCAFFCGDISEERSAAGVGPLLCVVSAAYEEFRVGVVAVVVCAFFYVLGDCGDADVHNGLFVWFSIPSKFLAWWLSPCT
jgi:hypothetical protein